MAPVDAADLRPRGEHLSISGENNRGGSSLKWHESGDAGVESPNAKTYRHRSSAFVSRDDRQEGGQLLARDLRDRLGRTPADHLGDAGRRRVIGDSEIANLRLSLTSDRQNCSSRLRCSGATRPATKTRPQAPGDSSGQVFH